ncbi:unnamed protein product [Prorocentrum cordatum]|uniref:Polycystin cation channel PKD1/PKD2 domain-containing protein n=1 Tax=Prorocentrum cordatum TaxID=2364126 RepID=A0ABN9U048_9DINO|nr:unnamed protein product [Polarella glacialis]|mmetsp:Transcript_85545/g.231785  ORF Transcript_85545/g.231785 Transcript_85545/m.231785 type:complete len:749 (+) Transcript_85545:63-2309(+)
MAENTGPTGLEVLVNEKAFNDLLAQQRGALAILKQGFNVILFIGFLILYTVLALGEPLDDFRAYEGYIRRRFDTDAAMPIADVDSSYNFWEYMRTSFIPGIYGNDTSIYFMPDYSVQKLMTIGGDEAHSNRLYGTVRMRMVKTLSDQDCKVADGFASAFPQCYGGYSEASEDKSSYGPINSIGDAEFDYTKMEAGSTICGSLSCYGPGGFIEALTSTYNASYTRLLYIENSGWISQGTRAVFVDFTIYNFNSGYYAVCSILFEVAPSGHWVHTFDVQILMERHLAPLGTGEMSDWMTLVGEIVLLGFVVRQIMEEAAEFIGCRNRGAGKIKIPRIKMEYFRDAWNILDWLNLLLIIVTFVIRLNTWSLTPPVDVLFNDAAGQGVSTFVDFSPLAKNVRTIRELIAFNAVLTWFKAVKYIDVFPYIAFLMQTVQGSQRHLLTWFCIFSTSLMGFVLAFTFAFGAEDPVFSTPWKTFVVLVRTLLGDSDMATVHERAPFTGALLLIAFVAIIFFTVMQLFVSLMLGALQDAKLTEELKQARQWHELVERTTELMVTVSVTFRLEERFKEFVPGLYYRYRRWKRGRYEHELRREESYEERQAKDLGGRQPLPLGAASPSWGRIKVKQGVMVQNDGEDSGSEPDLGPLHHASQLRAVEDNSGRRGSQSSLGSLDSGPKGPHATEDQVIDLVMESAGYIADGVVERTGAAKSLLFSEMTEARDILRNITTVVEVLNRRARDLELQQQQFTRHF